MTARSSVSQLFVFHLCLATLLCGLTGCETSDTAERSDVKTEPATPSIDTEDIVEQAEAARDRNLAFELEFEHVDSREALQQEANMPAKVASDRSFLLEHLFGVSSADRAAASLSGDLASYDKGAKTIRYRSGESDEQTRRAVFAAVVEAIDASQFESLPDAQTWDNFLAHQTARTTTAAFALASHEASENSRLSPTLLAARPEVVTRLDRLDILVNEPGTANPNSMYALETEFVHREAWTLASALYRANGWSGVELAWLMPPDSTADVVQPGNWLSGEPVADWQWPDSEAEPDRKGRVGAAVTSFWLAKTVSASALRTLFAGWTSDRYRHWKASDDSPERFEWMTLWDSPGSASQVTKAFELTLRERFPEVPEAHFVVFQKGLKVGVIISDEPADARRERARELLAAKVRFEPRDGLPISFVPTRSDVVAEETARSDVEGEVWRDPASGLRMDLSPLSEWKLDQPDSSAVRWFARGPDGALAQLTMEMTDPLGPEFGSQEYREGLRNAFTRTMNDTDISGISNSELPFGRTLQATLDGSVEGQPTRVRFWHFKTDDLIFTYSYQAPASSFGAHADLANQVIESTELEASSPKSDEDVPDTGIIEFEVEEN